MNIDKRWLTPARRCRKRRGRRGDRLTLAAPASSRRARRCSTRAISRPGRTKAATWRRPRRARSCRDPRIPAGRSVPRSVVLHAFAASRRLAIFRYFTPTRKRHHETNTDTPVDRHHFAGRRFGRRRQHHVLHGRQLPRPPVHRRSAGDELCPQRLQRPGQFGGRPRRPMGDLRRRRLPRQLQRPRPWRLSQPRRLRGPHQFRAPDRRALLRQSLRRPRPTPRSARDAVRRPESVRARLSAQRHDARTSARPDSTTARRRCASRAATGSSAATPNSAANAARSVPATMRRFRVSTT